MGRWWRWNEHLDRTKAELLISFFGHARPTSAQALTLFVALRPVQRQGSIPIVVLFGARSFPEKLPLPTDAHKRMRPQLPYLSERAVCQTKRSDRSQIKKDDRLHLTKNKT